MDPLTPDQARQVWQRVRGGDTGSDPLPRLLALEAELRHIYHWLQTHTLLRDNHLLARLREDSGRFSAILKGLCLVLDREYTVQAPPSVRGNPEGLLRQCFRDRAESLRLLSALPDGARESAALLEKQMQVHSLNLLELLGKLPK